MEIEFLDEINYLLIKIKDVAYKAIEVHSGDSMQTHQSQEVTPRCHF